MKILAIYTYPMDSSTRANSYSTKEEYEKDKERYKTIRALVVAMYVDEKNIVDIEKD